MPRPGFPFEQLDAYNLAREVARWVRRSRWSARDRSLEDQALRASESMLLNIAEGIMRGGKPGANHLRIAKGSAGELFAVLDLVELPGGPEAQARLRRVGAMLTRLRI